MALFQRFWTMLKSNLNHLIGKAEDPEKMLNQMMIDMQEQLILSKKQVAVAIADEKRLFAQLDVEKTKTQEWEKRAMMAVHAGDDQLATQALERQADHAKMAQSFEQQWQAQKMAVDKLKEALQKLSDKIEDAKRKKNLLVARAKRAEAQQTITETMSGMTTNNAFETMGRMEEKIQNMEAEAEATTELAHDISVDSLEARFEKLEVSNASERLKALKAKMGQAPQLEAHKRALPSLEQIEKEIEAEVQ